MQGLNGKDKPRAIVEGDTGHCTEHNLKEAEEREMEVLMPDQPFRKRDEPFAGRPEHGQRYTVEDVAYEEQGNSYRCPAGKERSSKGQVKLNRNSGEKYQGKSRDCKDCPLRQRCIVSRGRKIPNGRYT